MAKAPLIILEGTWWSNLEQPLVLPYFQALALSNRGLALSHRTIRSASDIEHYVKKIPKDAGAMLYFACHGEELQLYPDGVKSRVRREDLLTALAGGKSGAIRALHFGCCEMVDPANRRESHASMMDASKAEWVSGYTREVDWLASTLLDLALVSDVFLEVHGEYDRRSRELRGSPGKFLTDYDELARKLGFSALSKLVRTETLFPSRLHDRAPPHG